MTSNLSSSPVDNIYSPGGRCSAVGLDTLCTVSSTRADTASTVAAATANDCRSGLSSPAAGYCRSPDANSGITPGDFMQSISANSAAAIEAAALRLMLGGRNHLGHHQLPVLGVGPSSMAIGAGQASISHRQHHPMDSSAFYLPPNIQLAAEMASPDSNWAGLVYGSSVGLSPYDQRAATDYQSYLHCYGGIHDVRRKNATRESTSTLKSWLIQHIKNPYPTKGEKIMLAIITKMTLTQVSTWFANARRRLKKENKMQWSPRQRTGDDDDDDADDDVMNGSFSVSDDECSDDIIVDDREFNSSVAPRRSSQSPRLSSSADMSSLDHYANDRHHQHQQQQHRLHMTSSLIQRHAITTDVNHVTAHSVKSERDRNNSPTFGEEDAIGDDSEHDDVTSGNQHHHHHQHQATAASKPRIWSIAELATSGDKRRNSSSSSGSTTTITPTTSSVCDQTMLTSPSSLPSPGLPRHRESTPDADFRHQWNAANAGSEDAIHAFLRRQFSERMTPQSLPTTSISAGEHGVFPAAAVEALRWQMAAAACRAASAAVAAASSNRAAAAHRFDGSVPNVTTDSAGTRAVSALR